MTVTLTYDAQLSRVRVDASALDSTATHADVERSTDGVVWSAVRGGLGVPVSAPSLYSTGFEGGVTGWSVTSGGATIAQSSEQARTGSFSAKVAPDGTLATITVDLGSASAPAAAPGDSRTASVWVLAASTAAQIGPDGVRAVLLWYDAAGALLSTTAGVFATLETEVWTQFSVTGTAPASAASVGVRVEANETSMDAADTFYLDDVAISVADNASFDRPVDDYEFVADVANTYRVTAYDASGAQTDQQTSSITPTLTKVWLKSIARPWLNREVTVVEFSEVERAARTGVFPIVGRSFPVAVSDVRSGRSYTLEVLTETAANERDLDLFLASGDPAFVHVPAGSMVPGGYYTIGDTSARRLGRTSVKRVFALPLREIAAPGPDVVGSTSTWQTIVTGFATWQDVINAFPTWEDVLEHVADPSEVIVP